jgi:predicted  nucleic acid-binding Zn-ribbon protein
VTTHDAEMPSVGELIELVERLDADNERLRLARLELAKLMEDAVTEQVAGERRIAELEDRVALLERELEAINQTRLIRHTRPVRALYARFRRGGVGA